MGRKFTLIELFLTLGLIAMVGSLLLIQAKPMLDRYQFQQGVKKLERELRLSRRLAEAAHADVQVFIKPVKGGIECKRKTDEPLNLPHVLGKRIKIPHVHLCEKKKIEVTFTATGAFKGKRLLEVSNGKEKTEVQLVEKKRYSEYDKERKIFGDDNEIESPSI